MAEVWGDRQAEGSSPRVRGKPRISLSPSSSPGSSRACRENGGDPKKTNTSDGSSPRVRGKPPRHPVGGAHPRLIPARAGKTWSRTASGRTPRAHPRACGENVTLPVSIVVYGGSSPRVRGKPHQQRHPLTRARLIPARAGKTRGCSRAGTPRPAHPRACGENDVHAAASGRFGGSSPRVRGKRAPPSSAGHRGRLIPARAGKTRKPPASPPPETAHPRACGENDVPAAPVLPQLGSSPRVRGKRGHPPGHRVGAGLIPARAGKTARGGRPPRASRAHPRACGENRHCEGGAHGERGSSPRVRGKRPEPRPGFSRLRLIPARAGKQERRSRSPRGARLIPARAGKTAWTASGGPRTAARVRGKLVPHLQDRAPRRLIPACAGKTRPRAGNHPATPAHPRVCGENSRAALYPAMRVGSSPRVRGKPRRQHHHLPPRRLIPACAGKTASSPRIARPRRAHPRVCGENIFKWHRRSRRTGSSPRVRGKREQVPWPVPREGLIPACAGKTLAPAVGPGPHEAHPRVCGENGRPPRITAPHTGSSPRVRGKHRGRPRHRGQGGLIPACAGKTTTQQRCNALATAHPRVCGENSTSAASMPFLQDSSPRVRGKPPGRGVARAALGLIPACAGKTSALGSRWRPRGLIPACAGKTPGTCARGRRRAAHPRVCGENSRTSPTSAAALGSSPRVRGKPLGLLFAGIASGLIPACAGKTRAMRARARSPAAHPRVCGENVLSRPDHRAARGSSPRVRGKPLELGGLDADGRLIPACAGKTRTRPHSPGRAGAHPRVCGENLPGDQPPRPALGSSPRVRGKRGLQRRPRGFAGLIPACAGKTPMQALALARFSAHPRVCGENALPGPVGRDDDGSSPRVRGKPALGHTQTYDKRLIPACAGKT